ncbi:MAG: DUF2270 domain-containing protein [Alphaproteobacteria bacterium]|jgi:uncharacterized membrane protein|nr:DUF2270 domain-containing protein [Alphaproteobacteria bacterium]
MDLPDDPPLPHSTTEFVNVVAHYYRGELGRMAGWRDRMDRTTNWAITVVAAMLSVSLSTPTAHHGVLLFAMVLVLLLLVIEARRYRFFDVYRVRVRRIERNYLSAVFDPGAARATGWSAQLGQDLRRPIFLTTTATAFSRRLRRNYGWLFLILLAAWTLKISSIKLQQAGVRFEFVQSLWEIVDNAALGPIPGPAVVVGVALFHGWLAWCALRPDERIGEMAHGDVHV